MASTPTRGFRRPASPGRDRIRARASVRSTKSAPNTREQLVGKISDSLRQNLNRENPKIAISRRFMILVAIFALLLLCYGRSMQVYFTQQHDLAEANTRIVMQQKKIDELSTEINRWNDPAYVKAQARTRLGWILPGETGYQVLGDDGKLLGEGANLNANLDTRANWWDRMWGTLKIADKPA